MMKTNEIQSTTERVTDKADAVGIDAEAVDVGFDLLDELDCHDLDAVECGLLVVLGHEEVHLGARQRQLEVGSHEAQVATVAVEAVHAHDQVQPLVAQVRRQVDVVVALRIVVHHLSGSGRRRHGRVAAVALIGRGGRGDRCCGCSRCH